MGILVRLDSALFHPTLFLTLAGLSLTAAALLYVAAVRHRDERNKESSKCSRLSDLKPKYLEYRGTAYLIVAFGWFMLSFISFSFFRSIGAGSLACLSVEIIDKVVTLLFLFLGLCFLYAGAGDLLRAVTDQKGGITRYLIPRSRALLPLLWLKHLVVELCVENLIVRRFGDWLTRGLFRR